MIKRIIKGRLKALRGCISGLEVNNRRAGI